eukprot:COSAG05_NODE_6860_length_891_cov_1.905303_1_plen_113_part_10
MASQFASMVQEGYLLIKKNGILKSWTRRWFVLDSKTLTHYKNHSDVGIKFSKQVRVDEILEVIPPDVRQSCPKSPTTAAAAAASASPTFLSLPSVGALLTFAPSAQSERADSA